MYNQLDTKDFIFKNCMRVESVIVTFQNDEVSIVQQDIKNQDHSAHLYKN